MRHEMHTGEMYTGEIYAHDSGLSGGAGIAQGAPNRGVYARQRRRRRPASSNTMSTPNPHHGLNAVVLLSRTYVLRLLA